MSSKVRLLTASACSLLAAAMLMKGGDAVRPTDIAQAPARASASAAPDSHSTVLRFKLEQGKRYVYAFDREIEISGLSQKMPQIRYSGEVAFDVIHASDERIEAWVSATLKEHPELASVKLRAQMRPDGSEMAVFSTNPASHHDQAQAERQQISIIKDLLVHWNFALDEDTVGKYSAETRVIETAPTYSRMTKFKRRYLASSQPVPTLTESSHLMSWDFVLSLPRAISGHEKALLGAGTQGAQSKALYSIRFARVEENLNPSGDTSTHAFAESLSLYDEKREPVERTLAHARPWAELMSQVRSLGSLASSEKLALFGELVRSLRSNPARMDELASSLTSDVLRQGADSSLFKLVVGTLATVGTPQAQAALVGFYQDPQTPVSGKGTILTAFTTTQAKIDASTRDFLTRTFETERNSDLAQGAAFAAGSSLHASPYGEGSVAANDESVRRTINSLNRYWEQADASSSLHERLAALDAMGNSGSRDFLPLLSRLATQSSDPALQAKAVFSLRYMSDSGAIELLAQSLASEAQQVRLASANALAVAPWNERFRAPLTACASGDSSVSVQSACKSALVRAPQKIAQSQ